MSKDSQKDLNSALKNLQKYQAPDSIWENLNSNLDKISEEQPLQDALKQLPVYEPSSKVWEMISEDLSPQKSFFKVYRNVLSIAASVVILIGCGVFFFGNSGDANYQYAYSEEVVDERLQLNVEEPDEEAFAMIETICSERAFLCKHVDFQRLREDFDDLNSAYEELKYAISDFNTSPELMEEMTNIELERTVVFKQLLAML